MSVALNDLRDDGQVVTALGISLLGQAVSFGIYAAFFPFAVYITLRRRTRGLMNKIMFSLMIVSFLIAAGYFIFNIASLAVHVDRDFIHYITPKSRPLDSITKYFDLCNAVVLINVVLTDGAVLWRAWIICGALKKSKIVLLVTVGTLICSFVFVFLSIGLRSTIIYKDIQTHRPVDTSEPGRQSLVKVLVMAQLNAVVFSLLTNILATGCIGARLWSMWREFSNLPPSSKRLGISVNDILLIFIESGLLYCLSSTFLLVGRFKPLPQFSLATYYQPIHINFSALYPALLLVLIDRKTASKWEVQVNKPTDMEFSFKLEESFIVPISHSASDTESDRTIHPSMSMSNDKLSVGANQIKSNHS